MACSGQMQGTDSPSLAPQDPLDSCEAIVGAAQPRRAARAQVNHQEASYAGMSPVARRVLFGASGEETMPGERGNTMAMSELVVTCLSTTLSCYLLRSPALWDRAQAGVCSLSCIDRFTPFASLHSSRALSHSPVAAGPIMCLQSICMASCRDFLDLFIETSY